MKKNNHWCRVRRKEQGMYGTTAFFLCLLVVCIISVVCQEQGLAGQHCGAKGDWRNILIPDQWPPPEIKKKFSKLLGSVKTVPVYKACMGHDNCYGTSGANQKACDKQFLENMKTECDRVYTGVLEIPLREACHAAAQGYYRVVQKHGLQAFQNAQNKTKRPAASASGQSTEVTTQNRAGEQAKKIPRATAQSAGKQSNKEITFHKKSIETSERQEIPAVSGPIFFNSDFEAGDLTNWTPNGEAFQYQPTKGDNPIARKSLWSSNHQGDFWIGSFEKYRGNSNEKPGSRQGEKPTGELCSIVFEITGPRIGFLIGGGRKIRELSVVLIIEAQEVRKTTGNNTETMERMIWDVKEFQGKTAQIIIRDSSSKGWGHINVDDFRFI